MYFNNYAIYLCQPAYIACKYLFLMPLDVDLQQVNGSNIQFFQKGRHANSTNVVVAFTGPYERVVAKPAFFNSSCPVRIAYSRSYRRYIPVAYRVFLQKCEIIFVWFNTINFSSGKAGAKVQ